MIAPDARGRPDRSLLTWSTTKRPRVKRGSSFDELGNSETSPGLVALDAAALSRPLEPDSRRWGVVERAERPDASVGSKTGTRTGVIGPERGGAKVGNELE